MTAYRLAREAIRNGYRDARRLVDDRVAAPIAGQLYRALGSVAANIAEGYSRSSGGDRVWLFEYARGSARESIVWYEAAAPLPGADVVAERIGVLTEVRRLLLAIIPRERHRRVAKASM
jgi:four helix bundle protein